MKVFLFLFFVSFPHIVVGLTLLKVKLCFDFCAGLVSVFPRLVKLHRYVCVFREICLFYYSM